MPKSSTVNYIGTGGYISFDMISFDEYAYSGLVEITKDLTGNVTSTFNLTVFGDTSVYPTLIMTPISSGATLKIKNITNNNTFIEFKTDADGTQLIANEILTVDCENEIITTDQLAEYRYDNMSPEGDFLELLSGLNEIEVSGSMLLTIKYVNKYLF